MADLFKFRCYQCQKLIGAPASRFGKVVHCPRCSAELIVPSPDDEPVPEEESDPDAFRPEDLGLELNFQSERLLPPKKTPTPARLEPVGPDPIAYLTQVAEAGETPAPESEGKAGAESSDSSNEPDGSPILPELEAEPLVARRGHRSGPASLQPSPRARDVVLPRTVAVAWSLFAILALGFAFGSGLFVGHVLWK